MLGFWFQHRVSFCSQVGLELVVDGHLVSNLLSARITDLYYYAWLKKKGGGRRKKERGKKGRRALSQQEATSVFASKEKL